MYLHNVPFLWRAGRLVSQVVETWQVPLPSSPRPTRREMYRLRRLVDKVRDRRGVTEVRVAGYPHPIFIRAGTSDAEVLLQILVQHELGLDLAFAPEWIVDLGANIGVSSIYLANRFPEAKIVAVEVEHSNFELLARNCAPYPRIFPIAKAIWTGSGHVRVSNPDAQPWSFRVEEAAADDPGAIECVSINALMETFGMDEIGLVKMDIEGAERQVLSGALTPWLDRTRVLAVELHERHVPGCEAAYVRVLAGRRCSRTRRGEYEIAAFEHRVP
ncbi:MAG: FkbM family methyltransferase [Burkholderiales bacterium]|nr:FkbM family methyltransferase [Burkholderiales bacterium]